MKTAKKLVCARLWPKASITPLLALSPRYDEQRKSFSRREMQRMSDSQENPLLDDLGIRLTMIGEGYARFELEVQSRHLNRQGALQGGVSATILDAACGYAGLQLKDGTMGSAVTLMLSICYLGRVSAGRVFAEGRVSKRGRNIYFASAELTSENNDVIATAQGTFKSSVRLQHTQAKE